MRCNFKNYLEKISIGLLSIIVFLFPIQQKIISPFIVVWIVVTCIYMYKAKSKFRFNKSLVTLLSFYLLLIIGLLWTNNMNAGGFDLEVKMSLVIFPLVLSFVSYKAKLLRVIFYSFFVGLIIGSLYLLYGALLNYLIWPSVSYFFYVELSDQIHPTYLSLYYVAAMVFLFADLNLKTPLLFKRKTISLLLIFYFFIFNFLILSKVGIIAAVIFVVFYLVKWSVQNKKIAYFFIVIILLAGLFYKSYEKSSYFNQRVDELISGVTSDEGASNNGSTGIRLQIWEQGVSLIKQKPIFGYGTGDVKDVLVSRYEKIGMTSAYDKKLNAHNQFIQIAISLGLVGLFVFLYMLYESLSTGIKNNNIFIVNFVLMLVLYLFTESMLENQAGTIFFGLFFSLLNQKVFFTNE